MKIKVKGTKALLDVKFDEGKAITSGDLGVEFPDRIWKGIGRPDVVRIYESYMNAYGGGGWELIAEIAPTGVIYTGSSLEFDTEGLSVERSLDGGLPIYEFQRLDTIMRNEMSCSYYVDTRHYRFKNDEEALAYDEKYKNLYDAILAPDGRYIKGKKLL